MRQTSFDTCSLAHVLQLQLVGDSSYSQTMKNTEAAPERCTAEITV